MSQKDHYVSQTYLRSFTNESNLLVPYYKNREYIVGNARPTSSICHEKDGDANSFFKDPRILDQFLSLFENNWTDHVKALENMNGDENTKYGVAGYISFLRSCNPTAKRLGLSLVEESLTELSDKVMEKSSSDPNLKPELRKFYSENKEKEYFKLVVDPDYPHSIAITSLIKVTNQFYCSDWHVLINETQTPFITSDNPAILFFNNSSSIVGLTFVPISPKIGILIYPNEFTRSSNMEKFEHKNDKVRYIKEISVHKFNELVAKAAENVVIHSEKADWVESLVRKHKSWRVETRTTTVPSGGGSLTMYRQEAVDTTK